ncbi:zinc ribbon domain-containing protein [Aquabacterium sp.]|uniref:FmdB family zinc ribbon protein n=1 Tax=Aquabacterium sp. TaxID=1872578 RepID=UPI0035B455DA
MSESRQNTMPLYDYHCPACDNHFELLVRSSTVPTCPKCGSTNLEKCVTAPAAPGKSAAILKAARQRAAAEGHMSNYSQKERSKLLS